MIECSTADEAIKILSEVGFGDGAVIESALEFEKLIAIEQRKLLDFRLNMVRNVHFHQHGQLQDVELQLYLKIRDLQG